jgi:N-methylhydantoinase B/oxoprolinase/acetone carboxylase alpha subunit
LHCGKVAAVEASTTEERVPFATSSSAFQWRCINVGGKNSVKVSAGDRFVVQSPGGGAYGPVKETMDTAYVSLPRATFAPLAGGSIATMKSLGDQV